MKLQRSKYGLIRDSFIHPNLTLKQGLIVVLSFSLGRCLVFFFLAKSGQSFILEDCKYLSGKMYGVPN